MRDSCIMTAMFNNLSTVTKVSEVANFSSQYCMLRLNSKTIQIHTLFTCLCLCHVSIVWNQTRYRVKIKIEMRNPFILPDDSNLHQDILNQVGINEHIHIAQHENMVGLQAILSSDCCFLFIFDRFIRNSPHRLLSKISPLHGRGN